MSLNNFMNQIVNVFLLILNLMFLVSCSGSGHVSEASAEKSIVVDTIEVVQDCGDSEYSGEYLIYSCKGADTIFVAKERLSSGGLGYTFWYEIDDSKDSILFGKDFIEWQPIGDTLVYSSLQALTLDEKTGKYFEDDDFKMGEIVYMVVKRKLSNGFQVEINDSLNQPVEYLYKKID